MASFYRGLPCGKDPVPSGQTVLGLDVSEGIKSFSQTIHIIDCFVAAENPGGILAMTFVLGTCPCAKISFIRETKTLAHGGACASHWIAGIVGGWRSQFSYEKPDCHIALRASRNDERDFFNRPSTSVFKNPGKENGREILKKMCDDARPERTGVNIENAEQ